MLTPSFRQFDKSMRNKPIEDFPFVRIQIRGSSIQYAAKDRDFLVGDEVIRGGEWVPSRPNFGAGNRARRGRHSVR